MPPVLIQVISFCAVDGPPLFVSSSLSVDLLLSRRCSVCVVSLTLFSSGGRKTNPVMAGPSRHPSFNSDMRKQRARGLVWVLPRGETVRFASFCRPYLQLRSLLSIPFLPYLNSRS
jgi:hypothetical protein